MSDFILSCCSTADLTKEHFEKRNINYICFHYYLDDVEYSDDLGESMSFDEFYEKMVSGSETRTSQVNTDEFIEYFTPFLDKGFDILHVSLSSGLSGVYNTANIARDILSEKYPERKIYIVDSLAASSGYGLIMDKLADLRDQGKTIDEIKEYVEENKLNMNHWFFSTDLSFYVKGGRISKASGWFGTVLKICPLLDMDEMGKLIPRLKIRGKNKVIEEIVDTMSKHANDGTDYSGKCYISNSACLSDANAVKDLVEKTFPKLSEPVSIFDVGTTIGSHTGPGTVALFYWGDKREKTDNN